MTRIEKGSEVKEELQQMKGEVIKEISSTKKRHPFRNCTILIFIVIVGLLFAAVWAVASTGLVEVPVFSKFAFDKPEPERLVNPGVPIEKVLEEQVLSKLKTGSVNETISLTLTEESLTASLRSILESSADGLIDAGLSQVSISSDRGFTFFLPLSNSESGTALTLSVKANIKDGAVELIPEELKIGSLSVPDSFTALFLQSFVKDQLADANKILGSYVQIEEVEYKEGSVVVRGKVVAEVENKK
ncbi:hypothetical protein HY771_03350 [Candidatus Uhrbacteria bacterium]|nr:hypothetical protein [Candidatus Uhrbacteria bacterium]